MTNFKIYINIRYSFKSRSNRSNVVLSCSFKNPVWNQFKNIKISALPGTAGKIRCRSCSCYIELFIITISAVWKNKYILSATKCKLIYFLKMLWNGTYKLNHDTCNVVVTMLQRLGKYYKALKHLKVSKASYWRLTSKFSMTGLLCQVYVCMLKSFFMTSFFLTSLNVVCRHDAYTKCSAIYRCPMYYRAQFTLTSSLTDKFLLCQFFLWQVQLLKS